MQHRQIGFIYSESREENDSLPLVISLLSWWMEGLRGLLQLCAIISADEVLSRFTSKLSNCIIEKDAAHGNYLHCSGRVKIFLKFEIKGTSDRNIFTLRRLEIKTTWNCVKLFFWRWCNFIILERGHERSSSREKLIEVAMALMLSQISSLQSRYQHTSLHTNSKTFHGGSFL